jgi:hypothetical protein
MHDTIKQRESFWESYEKMQLCFALQGHCVAQGVSKRNISAFKIGVTNVSYGSVEGTGQC